MFVLLFILYTRMYLGTFLFIRIASFGLYYTGTLRAMYKIVHFAILVQRLFLYKIDTTYGKYYILSKYIKFKLSREIIL